MPPSGSWGKPHHHRPWEPRVGFSTSASASGAKRPGTSKPGNVLLLHTAVHTQKHTHTHTCAHTMMYMQTGHTHSCSPALPPQRSPMLQGKEEKSSSARRSQRTLVISSRVWDQPLPLQRERWHSDTLMWQQKGVCLGQGRLPSGYRH